MSMNTSRRQPIEQVKPGQVILPPARELSLWMWRHCQEQGLPESAVHLTVREIEEGMPDKKGRWLIVRCNQSPEWTKGQPGRSFNFKARPSTPWPIVA